MDSTTLTDAKHTALGRSDFTDHLRTERDRFVAFAFSSADILLELDAEYQIIYADGALHGLLGYTPEDLQAQSFFTLIEEEAQDSTRQKLDALSQTHRLEKQECKLVSRHGDALAFTISGFRMGELDKPTYLSLSLIRGEFPIGEIVKRDSNTGLYNKSGFIEAANQRLQDAHAAGESLEMTLVNLPELTPLLDELSPEQAGQLLSEISGYLREHSLGGDMAGQIDDDAFSYLHDTAQSPANVMEDLLKLTSRFDPSGQGITPVTQTMAADAGDLSPEDSANVLLYTLNEFASHAGESFTIASLSESYEQLLDDTVHKITHFKSTVDTGQFQLAFQPIVDLKSGLIHHYEVLVRMDNTDIFKNPFEFINFGEKTGVISEFDLIMTQRAFEVLERTAKQGNNPVIAVNVSGKSLGSMLFRDSLKTVIDQHDKLRKQVIFEVTESAKIDDLSQANAFIQELRQGGNLCCLDDFGTGESSFDYLRSLQVDFIKIDGSYVRESLQTPRGRHMLKAMASLCRDLSVTTIGEMVEDEKAAALLWEAGVRFGQGYLFGKPEVDEETIINCKKPTPFYGGMMRARKVPPQKRNW